MYIRELDFFQPPNEALESLSVCLFSPCRRSFVASTSPMSNHGQIPRVYDPLTRKSRAKPLTAWEQEQMKLCAPSAIYLDKVAVAQPMLSRTEVRVCAGIMCMKLSWEIGQIMGITEATVNNHRWHIRQKLGLEHEDHLTTYLYSLK